VSHQSFQHCQHASGGSEKERAADPINHDVAVGGLFGIVTRTGTCGIGNIVKRCWNAVDFYRFRHSMQEQQRAQYNANGDGGDEVDENRK
jgi:hypothetical protein